MSQSDHALAEIIAYMQAHWPSKVNPKWQVGLSQYPQILQQIIKDFTKNATQNQKLIRITGISGSGKTTQILPAVEAYNNKYHYHPVLVAARRFVKYHPHYQEIKTHYGESNLRQNTDDFTTIMLFLTLTELIKNGYDITLDLALLDPKIEALLLNALTAAKYEALILMIAVSPKVTEHFLKNRTWRHTKATENEFIRATKKALEFYAQTAPNLRIIIWSVYDEQPVYDGPIQNSLATFEAYSNKTTQPKNDDNSRKQAKIEYLLKSI